MEYRILLPTEYPHLLPLWQEAFGDSPDTVRAVLAALGEDAKCFAAEDGALCSMLFAVPQAVGTHPVAYIYAVATKRSHRGQGLAAALLSRAEAWAKTQGFHALLLCPATESLCSYYAKQGYRPWSENAAPQTAPTGEPISAAESLELREKALKNTPHNTPKSSVLSLYAVTNRGVWDGKRQIDSLSNPHSALAMYKPLTADFPKTGIFTFPMD